MSLKTKLRALEQDLETDVVNWNLKKTNWIKSVDTLYRTIKEEWLSELVTEELLRIKITPISISEEFIGNYSINKMEISFGNQCVVLEPVGTNIIGAQGRIDLYLSGEFGTGYMLVLSRDEDVDSWTLVDKLAAFNKAPLSRVNFEEVIEKWVNQ